MKLKIELHINIKCHENNEEIEVKNNKEFFGIKGEVWQEGARVFNNML